MKKKKKKDYSYFAIRSYKEKLQKMELPELCLEWERVMWGLNRNRKIPE